MSGPAGEARSIGPIDVLVVDDDSDILDELTDALSRAHLSCNSAGDGWGALRLLADGWRPAVVVSDLHLPELNGLEFAGHLNALPGRQRPEIIFVSGAAGFDDAVQAIRLGARDLLTKPVDGPRLIRAVKSALLDRQVRQREAPVVVPTGEGKETHPREDDPPRRRRETLDDLRAVRKVRDRHFPTELFSDPCWEMLLALYDAQLDEAEVTVSSLGAASGVPLTTALRRMEVLQKHGFIERVVDPDDRRRTIVRLSAPGLVAVEKFFDSYAQRLKR
jgi:CheY-like chemotaxis protein/DNA-binding MarR family transcriptional regulator